MLPFELVVVAVSDGAPPVRADVPVRGSARGSVRLPVAVAVPADAVAVAETFVVGEAVAEPPAEAPVCTGASPPSATDRGTGPELARTSSRGANRVVGDGWPSGSITARSSCQAWRPSSCWGTATVVRDGVAYRASSMSSKPVTEMSPGTATPDSLRPASSPNAATSLKATTAVARVARTSSTDPCPAPTVDPPGISMISTAWRAATSSRPRRRWASEALAGGPARYTTRRWPSETRCSSTAAAPAR
ncbi:hypothetical protein GCM10025865_06610 [Paraoerskovia sediminicola]|uniref:Uncharacterized protein n=1 Tax=Paraoerskovia sediminicola TaxID=1138587 RepID=A0ABN6X956_9CELL|nr:hypothetical protein GCM10025865_06610 [Paraoerskovia sediminicola]